MDELARDKKLAYAVQHAIAILGEASNRVSAETQARLTGTEWRKIKGIRNHFVHEYGKVQLDTIWEVVTRDLPVLESALRDFLQSLDSP